MLTTMNLKFQIMKWCTILLNAVANLKIRLLLHLCTQLVIVELNILLIAVVCLPNMMDNKLSYFLGQLT